MFWKKKTPLQQKIEEYKKDQEVLLEFARTVAKSRIEEVTLEDIKGYYKAIVDPKNSNWERTSMMLAVRKFFRANRGENVLKAKLILDNPLNSVAINDKVQFMQNEKKRGKGRPAQVEIIKKVISLREKEKLSFRAIARALDRDLGQVHVWYKRRDILLRGELSPD